MPLKRTIDADAFEALPGAIQEHYTKEGEGYILDVEGIPDTARLERALAREREAAKTNGEKVRELSAELDEIQKSRTGKEKDLDELTKAHRRQIQEAEAKFSAELSKRNGYIEKTLRQSTAERLAAEISTAPKIMARFIQDRLSVDMDADEPTLVVLDERGQPSAATIDQLKKEILTSPDFKDIIRANTGSGGRTNPGQKTSGDVRPDGKPADLSTLPAADLLAVMREKVGPLE